MTKKAQATLEFSLIFILVAALIIGLIGLWRWSVENIPKRQGAFEATRIVAGEKATPGTPEPNGTVFSAGTPGEPAMLSAPSSAK
jgi:hypothetical protein